jgi:hypothetical protein
MRTYGSILYSIYFRQIDSWRNLVLQARQTVVADVEWDLVVAGLWSLKVVRRSCKSSTGPAIVWYQLQQTFDFILSYFFDIFLPC